MEKNLRNIKELYRGGNLIPFIGAGLSTPFKIPDWDKLIRRISDEYMKDFQNLKPAVNAYLDKKDFWTAMETILNFAPLTEDDIQQEIVDIINEEMQEPVDNDSHNYLDLANMDFNVYLTTNYEHLITSYMSKNNYIPLVLSEINFNTQTLFRDKKKRVFHLHGHVSNSGTIVITRNQYKKLYENNKYENILRLFTGTKSLLFIGFSFDDQFIKQMIKDHKQFFKGNHYILLNKPSDEIINELKVEYGLSVIKYDVTNSSHAVEIRKILNQIKSKDIIDNVDSGILDLDSLIGVTLEVSKKDLHNSLFYKKLVLENLDKNILEISELYYISADEYIHKLSKNRIQKEIIQRLLFVVFIRYKEVLVNTYEQHGNSYEFVKEVHAILKGIDYGRLNEFLSLKNKPFDFENQGFIHILADDLNYDVWWGKERLNGN
ncbi:SIR2 family NAD-dependent protein deacylase [Clostridium tagluense]|uniref:SIR2 family NAD-dependent protein deacylase n=1 Tax=Clostridium tagluense TaxID=360422 RepID=UPI001C6EBA89|nr:SIR2 family protein [Clostridium tagluense]MBW9157675.1 SIR2 family protein [Clostridium tagluense]WLC67036.1 SIR2 family protein [Clostridium tagluense]